MLEKPTEHGQTEIVKQPFPFYNLNIVDSSEQIYSVEPRDYFEKCKEHGVVYRISRRSLFRDSGIFTDYALLELIDDEEFLFRIVKAFGYDEYTYSIDFMTERYNYALMNLSFEGLKKLEQTILTFIKTIFDADEQVQSIRFSGAGSSYSKEDVEEGRKYLQENVSDEVDVETLKTADAYEIKNMLSRAGVKNAKMSEAANNIGRKRDRVFSKRLTKLFEQYELPYTIESNLYISDVFIKK